MAKSVTIIAVGQKHDRHLVDAIAVYEQRLKQVMPLEWRFLTPSPLSGMPCRHAESVQILREFKDGDYVVLLDEKGTQLSSEGFSDVLHDALVMSRGRTIFVIGGAYGVDESVHSRASHVMSLSTLVFPHQLVRLILAEQLYRAHAIAQRHPYHHQ